MIITRNAVYNYIYDAVIAVYSTMYVAGAYEPVPASMPAVFVSEISDLRNKANMTFASVQGVRTSTFEVQIVCGKLNGSLTQAYEILDVVRAAFFKIAYNEINVVVVENGRNGTNYRLRASYRRVIGDADAMPTT